MAHNAEKTKCWIDSNSGIDFTADVAAVLGRASTDEGCLCADVTDVGCNDPGGKVNKWARHKPVRFAKLGKLTDENLKAVNFGLGVTTIGATTALDCLAQAQNNNGVWPYLAPTGGQNEPLRIHDFDQYNNIAIEPFAVSASSYASNNGNIKRITIYIDDNEFEGSEIKLKELEGLASYSEVGRAIGDWRVGAIVRRGNEDPFVVYSSKTLSKSFIDVDGEGGSEALVLDVLYAGTYDYTAFITDYNPSDEDPDASYRYVFIDGQSSPTVTVTIPTTHFSIEMTNLELVPTYRTDGSLSRLDLTGYFDMYGRTDEPDVTLYAELFYYDSAGDAWTPLHPTWPHETGQLLTDGDYVEMAFTGLQLPPEQYKLGLYYVFPNLSNPNVNETIYVDPLTLHLYASGQPVDHLINLSLLLNEEEL